MPRPKEYHKRIDVLTTREQWRAIEQYAKCYGLRWGEAVRELIERALEQDKGGWQMTPAPKGFTDKPFTKAQRKEFQDHMDTVILRFMWERHQAGNPDDWRVQLQPVKAEPQG